MAWIRYHRALLGYVFLVVVAVIAVELHHYQTTNELNRRDRVSCAQRNRLAANQRAVLNALSTVIVLELNEDEHPEGDARDLRVHLVDMHRRLLEAEPEPC